MPNKTRSTDEAHGSHRKVVDDRLDDVIDAFKEKTDEDAPVPLELIEKLARPGDGATLTSSG